MGVLGHALNSSTQEAEADKTKKSLGGLGMVMLTRNPSHWETEAGFQ